MAEATTSIPHIPMIGDRAIIAFALHVSGQRVKEAIPRRGDKVSECGFRDICELAEEYLRSYRDAVMRDVLVTRYTALAPDRFRNFWRD